MRNINKNIPFLFCFLCSCSSPLVEVFENYKVNAHKIDSLCVYFNEIKPDSIDLWIRFNKNNTFDINLWNKRKTKTSNDFFDEYGSFSKYDNSINDSLARKALAFISINLKQLDSLKNFLARVNCISIGYKIEFWDISNAGGYTEIGYPTNDLYGLSYIIMDTVKSLEFLNDIKTKCNYKVINNRTLLEYGGPAWGSDCFPDKK